MTLVILSAGLIAFAMAIMAVGVVFKNRCLRGSCGGPDVFDANGEPISCGACPKRREHVAEECETESVPT